MRLAELFLNFTSTILLASIGAYFSYNYRIQTRLKVLELRVDAYRKLFAATESASPTRLGRGDHLSEEDSRRLGESIYRWYYDNGNGLLMPNRTRKHLQWLQRTLQKEPNLETSPDPMIGEISKLRTMLRQDVGIFSGRETGWFGDG